MNAMSDVPRPTKTSVTQDLPTYDAEALTAGGAQACITLDGQVYFLRITKAGKLILTK